MRFLILATIILTLFVILTLLRTEQGFQGSTMPPAANQDFLDKSMWADKIKNKPAPPGVDFVGEVVYAPVDLAADIANIKNQLSNIVLNQPGDIRSQVNQQISPLVGGVLRQHGFPMTDETYGLSC